MLHLLEVSLIISLRLVGQLKGLTMDAALSIDRQVDVELMIINM